MNFGVVRGLFEVGFNEIKCFFAASGEPPLVLAASVHCATRAAIKEARKQLCTWRHQLEFDCSIILEVPATMPVVKESCGLDCVESYLTWIKESRSTRI